MVSEPRPEGSNLEHALIAAKQLLLRQTLSPTAFSAACLLISACFLLPLRVSDVLCERRVAQAACSWEEGDAKTTKMPRMMVVRCFLPVMASRRRVTQLIIGGFESQSN